MLGTGLELRLQLRLMQGVFSNSNDNLFFNDIDPHEPPLQASSSLLLRIQIWSIYCVKYSTNTLIRYMMIMIWIKR